MRHFFRLLEGQAVGGMMAEVMSQPELWNQHRWRQEYAGSPHGDVDDIWLRYASPQATGSKDELGPVVEDLSPVWYPAAKCLPAIRKFTLDLMNGLGAYALMRLLVTRLPPGGTILRHKDAAGAYVEADDIVRYHVVLQGLPGSLFTCEDETVNMRTGEIWWFNAHVEHEIVNNSKDDRVHLLVDMRLWR